MAPTSDDRLEDSQEDRGLDSLRCWLLAFGGAIIFLVTNGATRIYALLFSSLLDDNPTLTREAASWPFTMVNAAIIFSAPLAGFMSYRTSSRTTIIFGIILYSLGSFVCYFNNNIVFLAVFFGVVRGFGSGLATTTIPGLINNHCKTFRATAMGIATTGTPVGGLVLPLVIEQCLNAYGLKITFLVFGGICLSSVIAGLMISDPSRTLKYYEEKSLSQEASGYQEPLIRKHADDEESNEEISDSKVKTLNSTEHIRSSETEPLLPKSVSIWQRLKAVLTSRGFHLITFTNTMALLILSFYTLTIADYSTDKGIDNGLTVYMLTSFAGAEIAGRVLLGWVVDRQLVRTGFCIAASFIVAGSAVLMISFFSAFAEILSCAILLGISQGIVVSTTKVVYVDYISKDNMMLAMGAARSLTNSVSLLTSPLVGLFRDNLGSYDYLFVTLAALLYVFALAWIAEEIYKRKPVRNKLAVKK